MTIETLTRAIDNFEEKFGLLPKRLCMSLATKNAFIEQCTTLDRDQLRQAESRHPDWMWSFCSIPITLDESMSFGKVKMCLK